MRTNVWPAAKLRTSRCIPLEKMVDWSTESTLFHTVPTSNWPERIELVPGSRRGGQKEVEDGLVRGRIPRGRFLSLFFSLGHPRDDILEFRDAHAAPSLLREVFFISVATSARGIGFRCGRVLIKFGTRHRGAEFRTSCTPRESGWLSS